jgi:hypothetical protein
MELLIDGSDLSQFDAYGEVYGTDVPQLLRRIIKLKWKHRSVRLKTLRGTTELTSQQAKTLCNSWCDRAVRDIDYIFGAYSMSKYSKPAFNNLSQDFKLKFLRDLKLIVKVEVNTYVENCK